MLNDDSIWGRNVNESLLQHTYLYFRFLICGYLKPNSLGMFEPTNIIAELFQIAWQVACLAGNNSFCPSLVINHYYYILMAATKRSQKSHASTLSIFSANLIFCKVHSVLALKFCRHAHLSLKPSSLIRNTTQYERSHLSQAFCCAKSAKNSPGHRSVIR